MKVYIPTNRGPTLQKTYNKISREDIATYDVSLLVDDRELGFQLADAGYNVTIHETGPGILASRLYALSVGDDPKVLMLDDDLTNWAHRYDGKYIKGDDSRTIHAALTVVDGLLDKSAHAGIGHRQFANAKGIIDKNGRIMRALGYRRDILYGLKLAPTLPLMEDFELNLKLLTHGCSSMNYYGVVQDQSASNNPGGCHDIRTLELQEHCARVLHDMFPEFVKLKKVDGWDIGPRWDVSVQWKKAAAYGGCK